MEKKYFCNSNLSRFCDLGLAISLILSGIFCGVKYLNWFGILSGSYFFILFLESFRFIIFENDSITYRNRLLIKRKISVEMSLRLSKYFGTTSKFWLNMQNELDLREIQEKLGNDLDKIPSCKQIA